MDLVLKPNCTSSVWMYFGFKADENGRPMDLGDPICRLCRKIVRVKGGNTTNLRAHLKSRHQKEFWRSRTCMQDIQAGLQGCETNDVGKSEEGQDVRRSHDKDGGFDLSHEDLIEDFTFQTTPSQNYIPDAVLPPGEPWLQGGPSRAMASVPSCLRLWGEPGSSGATGPRDPNEERSGEVKVYAKYHLQQSLMFGPFVGELVRGQLQTSLKYAWAIRDDAAFYYIDATDENKSNWMRYVTYANSEEEHNLTVFQFYRQIYYRVSQPIPEGGELKVWIGKDYAAMLGLGIGENMKCDVGDKETILRIFQDIQVVTLPEATGSSQWSDNSHSQSPMPVITDVTSMLHTDAAVDSAPGSNSVSSSSSLSPFPLLTSTLPSERYDFIPGAEKLISHPNAPRKGVWYFFGFEPDLAGRPLERTKVVCKLCGEHVGCGGGATELQIHLTSKHHIKPRDVIKDVRERIYAASGQKSQAPFFGSNLDSPLMLSRLVGTFPQVMATQATDAITNFLIKDLHPPSLIEGAGFRQLIQTLLPSYRELPSATLLESLLKDLHTKGRRSILQLLSGKTNVEDEEMVSDYTAPIEDDYTASRRRGRPPKCPKGVSHYVTLSFDVWFHEWQGDTERHATLWAHFIDANFGFQNLALTTRRLEETGEYNLKTVEAQVKAMAHHWGIFQYNLVLLGGEGSEKLRFGIKKRERSGESLGSGPHPNSTTFLEREDSVSSDELTGLEHGHPSTDNLPSIPCFLTAAQSCVEEVMSHPAISKTLAQFQRVLSTLFPLHDQNKGLSQDTIQNVFLTVSRQEQAQLKSWAHSRPRWNTLYSLLNTLLKHQNLVCDMIKEVRGDVPTKVEPSDFTDSETKPTDNCQNSAPSTSSTSTIVVPKRSDWKVLEELCSVLKPLDVACRTLAKEDFPRLSLVKPILTGLLSRHLVSRPGDSSTVLKEVKRMMRRNLASCYENPAINRILCVACSLDPQFRGLGFMEQKEQTATYEWLKKEVVRIVKEDNVKTEKRRENKRNLSLLLESDMEYVRRSKRLKETPPINFKETEDEEDEESDAEEAEAEAESESGDPGSQEGLSGMEFLLGDLFGSAPQNKQSSVEESVDMEMSVYRADKGASLGVEPLQWWRTKSGQLPLLAKVARVYLAAPAVAGSAAKSFQQEGEATYKKRSNIPPECLDEILFLHYNHIPTTIIGQQAARKDDKM